MTFNVDLDEKFHCICICICFGPKGLKNDEYLIFCSIVELAVIYLDICRVGVR